MFLHIWVSRIEAERRHQLLFRCRGISQLSVVIGGLHHSANLLLASNLIRCQISPVAGVKPMCRRKHFDRLLGFLIAQCVRAFTEQLACFGALLWSGSGYGRDGRDGSSSRIAVSVATPRRWSLLSDRLRNTGENAKRNGDCRGCELFQPKAYCSNGVAEDTTFFAFLKREAMRWTLLCHWKERLPLSTTRSLFRAYQLHSRKNRAFGPGGTLQSELDLGRVQLQICHDAAQGIAMHAQLPRCLALIAFVVAKNFLNIAAAKLADSLFISDSAGVHLYDQIVQFAFHSDLTCLVWLL